MAAGKKVEPIPGNTAKKNGLAQESSNPIETHEEEKVNEAVTQGNCVFQFPHQSSQLSVAGTALTSHQLPSL